MNLLEATWTDADNFDGSLAVLPVGSTEQHGPHAPLGTDFLAARAIAHAGVEQADSRAVIAPAIPVGVAAEHRHFTGTLWVSEDTFRSYVRETVESLAASGWNRVVIVNGHGGNVASLREVCGRLVREEVAYAVPYTWFEAIDVEDAGGANLAMGHGGPVETSLLRHIEAELVRSDRFEMAADGSASRWGDWQAGINLAFDTAEFSENGVVGDPGESSAELGEVLFERAVRQLGNLLDAVTQREVTRPGHR